MDAWENIWYSIDTKGRGKITARELEQYMTKTGSFEEDAAAQWLKKFDRDGTGIIELQVFCFELGLNYKKVAAEVRARVSGGVTGLPAGVEFISGDMDLAWQIKIAQLCLEGLRTNSAMKDVPKWVKTQADRLYNQLWHVVAVNGQFWCYYGHEPGFSFVFRYEKFVFIIWKTPLA